MKCIKCENELSSDDLCCSKCGTSQEIGKKEAWDRALGLRAVEKTDNQFGGRAPLYVVLTALMLAVLLAFVFSDALVAYDYKALGFADKGEMESAFAKGYHTKQKLDEMSPKVASSPKIVASAAESTASSPGVVASETVLTPPVSANTTAPEAPKAVETSADISICTALQTCVDWMLIAARTENMGQVLGLAKQIDAMPKPQRGDRKLARKLNADGLDLFSQKKYSEAASVLIKARELDPMDEEIAGSIAFAYGESRNYPLAEKFAYEAILLNPRRSNHWAVLGLAKQGQGKNKEALQAMWIVWQFSKDKQQLTEFFEKRIGGETDENIKSLFISSKSWLVDGKKPSF